MRELGESAAGMEEEKARLEMEPFSMIPSLLISVVHSASVLSFANCCGLYRSRDLMPSES